MEARQQVVQAVLATAILQSGSELRFKVRAVA